MNLSEARGLVLFRVIRGASSVIGLGDTAQISCEAQPAESGIRLVYHAALVVGSNELVILFRAERARPESWVPPALGWSVAQGLRPTTTNFMPLWTARSRQAVLGGDQ